MPWQDFVKIAKFAIACISGHKCRAFLSFFFFFFFNIHTSDKLEIFFDHSILVNGVDPWGVHRFLGGINHENGIYSMGQRHECGLAQRLNYWPPNLTDEGSSPGVSFSFFFFLFLFFFFSIFILQIS